MLKVILFDWDGTCHNSLSKIIHCYEHAMKTLGYKPDWESVHIYLGFPIPVFSGYACPEKPEEYVKEYLKEYLSLPEAPLYEGTLKTLTELKKDFSLGLVTGKPKVNTVSCLENVGMSHIFDCMVCAEDTERAKPYADPLLKALDYFNVKPNEAVYIGDAFNDFKASKAAGVPVIAVTWGGLRREETENENPDFIADTWEDVINICRKLK